MAIVKGQQQLRAEERRALKLAEISEQIASGTLRVRQMTPAERALSPARPRASAAGRRAATARPRGRS